jgi:hypothetical protein
MRATMSSPPPSVDFSGKWYNQRGSEMDLMVDGSIVTGTCKTKIASPNRQDSFDLTGFATGDLISFTMNFGKFGTLTSWAGQYAKEGEEPEMIHTCFVAAIDVAETREPYALGWR